MLIVEIDASITDLRARAESIGSCNLNNVPVKPDCYGAIPEPTFVTYIDYDDPFAMVDSFSGAPHISKLSPNAWVGCGSNILVLECLGKGYIRIEPNPEGEGECSIIEFGPKTLIENAACFSATYTEATMHFSSARQLKVSPFMRKRLISTADALSDALRACDTYAVQKVLRGPLALGCGFIGTFCVVADLKQFTSECQVAASPGHRKPEGIYQKEERKAGNRSGKRCRGHGEAYQRGSCEHHHAPEAWGSSTLFLFLKFV